MKPKILSLVFGLMGVTSAASEAAPHCRGAGVWLQVLGSGGPELTDQRASSGYLVWQDGRARIWVDIGAGTLLRYEQSGARVEDLDVILISHLHVDHTADLPALLKALFFTDRKRELPIYGPIGNQLMPDTEGFVQSLFAAPAGAYRYLAGHLTGEGSFRLLPHNVSSVGTAVQPVMEGEGFKISAVPVSHGAIPALAWRIEIGKYALAFSGDMTGDNDALPDLAQGVGLLVAHHAIAEDAEGVARNLHMPPSVIGQIAAKAKVKQLVLSHRMTRTRGRELQSQREIRKRYSGPLAFAEDGQCFSVRRQ